MTISVTGCSTCRRVFISMKKNSSGSVGGHDELDGARADVVDAAGGVARGGADAGAGRRVQQRRRRLLDDLLMAALQAALALTEVDDVAVAVGEHLHLDVPRVPARIARGTACRRRRPAADLAARAGERSRQLRRVVHHPHALAAAAGRRLHQDRDSRRRRRRRSGRRRSGRAGRCRARRARRTPTPPPWRRSCRPSSAIAATGGPMNTMPAACSAAANSAFSERNP